MDEKIKEIALRVAQEMGKEYVQGWIPLCDFNKYASRLVAELQKDAKPVAWMVPRILSFNGAISTSASPAMREMLEGTVMWEASLIGDAPPVTDKHGIALSPMPLYAHPPLPAADRIEQLEQCLLQTQNAAINLTEQNKALREALEWLESRAMKHWIGNPMHVEASICLPRIRTALSATDKGEKG